MYSILGTTNTGPGGSCEGGASKTQVEIIRDDCNMVEWIEPGKKFVMHLKYNNDMDCYVVMQNPNLETYQVKSTNFYVSSSNL